MTVASKLGIAFAVIVTSVALAQVHPFGDPKRDSQESREGLLQAAGMPDSARRTLVTKCADCHSNATRWPVYSRVAPASWLIERDVAEGRRHMNLSRWHELSSDQQQSLEQEIAQEAKAGEMPPVQYRLLHWTARLNAADRAALGALAPAGDGELGTAKAGDAERGRDLFGGRCTGCHALDADREGPRLRGVYGRRAGSVPGFGYSSALRNSGVTWSDATLERWLSGTDAMVPGNAMEFFVPRAQERADLIAFLKSLH
ncbi:heme-binding domain-containing protein [Occallatibacter riparius]|uniref:Heme-binding domain-containing protein n=1 Tax=Occallatibacter riparius TaxID=1002689 RepID=A0A9J7BPN7_9BACT|nr:heme-binding domain-containing protein [Occallatibacter riparius]UWZ84672.1 heme-binding domain-containing protein [Occallatibacter riparius]